MYPSMRRSRIESGRDPPPLSGCRFNRGGRLGEVGVATYQLENRGMRWWTLCFRSACRRHNRWYSQTNRRQRPQDKFNKLEITLWWRNFTSTTWVVYVMISMWDSVFSWCWRYAHGPTSLLLLRNEFMCFISFVLRPWSLRGRVRL